MFGFFKKKKAQEELRQEFSQEQAIQIVDSKLRHAFSKVGQDINNINSWITHLNEAHNTVYNEVKGHITINKQEIDHLKQWIKYLNTHTSAVRSETKQIYSNVDRLRQENIALHKRIDALESKISAKTSVQTPNTARHFENDTQLRGVTRNDVSFSSHFLAEKPLSSTEKKVVKVLYETDKPLTYSRLSKAIGLNYGTVKNIIYSLRKKKIGVEDQVTPEGEKEFFLPHKVKVELSGR